MTESEEVNSQEQAGIRRFPIREEVRYRIEKKNHSTVGSGETIDIASTEVSFTTTKQLPLGEKVEVAVNWPVLLNNDCALRLIASGRIVESRENFAALRIERYEFRTRARVQLEPR